MALIMNASVETANFRVYGAYFSLKPGQIKTFQDHIARFIAINDGTKGLGLVPVPDELEDIEYRASAEGQKLLDERRKEGIANRVATLRQVIYNNQVSLRQDLEKSNIKADPKVFASDGEVSAYEELVKYQAKKDDEEQRKVERLKELEAKLK